MDDVLDGLHSLKFSVSNNGFLKGVGGLSNVTFMVSITLRVFGSQMR